MNTHTQQRLRRPSPFSGENEEESSAEREAVARDGDVKESREKKKIPGKGKRSSCFSLC